MIILQTVIRQLHVSTFLIEDRATVEFNVLPGFLRLDKCRDYVERLCFGSVPFCCMVIGKGTLILVIPENERVFDKDHKTLMSHTKEMMQIQFQMYFYTCCLKIN